MSNADFFGGGAEDGFRGVAVGIVTDNEDPQNLARVKLRFPWRDDDDTSHWARIATPMAGDDFGTYFLPEVGDEVLVAFEEGDMHHPYVLGSLWSGDTSPPEKNEGDNDVREVSSRSGHQIELDDASDEEKVKIETSGGHTITLDDTGGSEKITIEGDSGNNSITLDSASDEVSIEANSKIDLSATEISLSADSELSLSGSTVKGEADSQLELKSNGMGKVESTGNLKLSSTAILTIEGTMVKIN